MPSTQAAPCCLQVSKLMRGGPGNVQQNVQAMMMQKMMEQMMSGKGGGMPGMGGMDPSSNPFAAMMGGSSGGGGSGGAAGAGNPFANMPPFPQQPAQSSPAASRCAPGSSRVQLYMVATDGGGQRAVYCIQKADCCESVDVASELSPSALRHCSPGFPASGNFPASPAYDTTASTAAKQPEQPPSASPTETKQPAPAPAASAGSAAASSSAPERPKRSAFVDVDDEDGSGGTAAVGSSGGGAEAPREPEVRWAPPVFDIVDTI